jgi:hypothetical protein
MTTSTTPAIGAEAGGRDAAAAREPSAGGTHDAPGSRRASWFPVFAPIIAWGLHGALSVVVTIHGCRVHRYGVAVATVLVAGALAVAVAAAGLFKAHATLRRLGVVNAFTKNTVSNEQAIAKVGLLSSAVFGLAVILDMLPPLLLVGLCEVAR